MKKHHEVDGIAIERGVLSLVVDGQRIQRDLKQISPALAAATEEAQKEFEVSPSGYGIHWTLIDEDISIDGLLGVAHHPTLSRRSA
ncbi:MAG: hypothetical protein CRU78_00955 [Candidatus Accumulibacter phosphatis]|uniref:DUF2442 domain-containing protein n=1 Tax=Candidatus Accumulibacter phosphatis TaxID=327160 RepID=A0A6A7RNR8_9PROT|nr:hypothetical protein [Candidatus Accumulibacter phosphatis]